MPTETQATSSWLRWLPVFVLLLAIIGQAVLMQTMNADRQAGSGFAMFSSVDFAGSRAVVVEGSLGGARVAIELPSATNDDVDQLLITPTNGRAEALADTLATFGWSLNGETAQTGGDQSLNSITVTVRGLAADGRELSSQVLAVGMRP